MWSLMSCSDTQNYLTIRYSDHASFKDNSCFIKCRWTWEPLLTLQYLYKIIIGIPRCLHMFNYSLGQGGCNVGSRDIGNVLFQGLYVGQSGTRTRTALIDDCPLEAERSWGSRVPWQVNIHAANGKAGDTKDCRIGYPISYLLTATCLWLNIDRRRFRSFHWAGSSHGAPMTFRILKRLHDFTTFWSVSTLSCLSTWLLLLSCRGGMNCWRSSAIMPWFTRSWQSSPRTSIWSWSSRTPTYSTRHTRQNLYKRLLTFG